MTYARAMSVGLVGMRGHLVEVEADIASGLPGAVITGLPDTSVMQARDRVRAAIGNVGANWPSNRITVSLLPATLPKHGSAFDVAVATAVLCADEQLPADSLAGLVMLGELGLDGRVLPIRGVLPAVVAASDAGVDRVLVPAVNAAEARLVPGVEVVAVDTLGHVLARLRGEPTEPVSEPTQPAARQRPPLDLAEVIGQDDARHALVVAAAGGHHLAMFGPPGSGKTMLAERLPGLLPTLADDEALEVTAVHSVAGALPPGSPLLRQPPYQAPHHTSSVASLVGGGTGLARPGMLSLAHRGVLFLDEAPEFATGTLDALRQPIETGEVVLARSGGVTRYPARVQLVLAANPCPCSSATGERVCICSPRTRMRYLARISGPLLDRIDLQITLRPVTRAQLLLDTPGDTTSATAAGRVLAARQAAAARWKADEGHPGGPPPGRPWRTNAEVPGHALRGRYRLPRTVTRTADAELDRGAVSARGYDRILRAAWTFADLEGRSAPNAGDVDEATCFRMRRAA
jgi:magnesium chelatase family protein